MGEVRIGSVSLRHPVMTASGTAGYGIELGRYLDLSSLGAVVVKSLAHFPWEGNPAPRLAPVPGGMLNAVGLQGPGIAEWIRHGLVDLERVGARVVLSVWGFRVEDYVRAAELIAPIANRLTAVEVNLSCPNIDHGSDGSSHEMFAHDADLIGAILRGMSTVGVPLWAKLSANTTELVAMARAARDAGADAVTLINTMRGMSLVEGGRRASLGKGAGDSSDRTTCGL
jgi:dihydroorotate dehydrogenase (NAD+) catalytic subunit